jgi:hypothetical protein
MFLFYHLLVTKIVYPTFLKLDLLVQREAAPLICYIFSPGSGLHSG